VEEINLTLILIAIILGLGGTIGAIKIIFPQDRTDIDKVVGGDRNTGPQPPVPEGRTLDEALINVLQNMDASKYSLAALYDNAGGYMKVDKIRELILPVIDGPISQKAVYAVLRNLQSGPFVEMHPKYTDHFKITSLGKDLHQRIVHSRAY